MLACADGSAAISESSLVLSPQRVSQRELTPQRFVGWSPRSDAASERAVNCRVKTYEPKAERAELVYGRTSFHGVVSS